MISSLLPYLRHHYPKIRKTKLDQCFSLGAIEAAHFAKWDEEKQCVVTLEDQQVEDIAEYADDDDDWASSAYTVAEQKTMPDASTKDPPRPTLGDFTELTCPQPTPEQMAAVEIMEASVSTVGTAGVVQSSLATSSSHHRNSTSHTATRSRHISPPQTVNPTNSSVGQSVLSTDTFESRISTLEATVNRMTDSLAPLQTLQHQLAELLNRQTGNPTPFPPVPLRAPLAQDP